MIEENDPEEMKKMKILVNSGDNGEVRIPIGIHSENNYTIDWGDGSASSVVRYGNKYIKNEKRIASIDGVRVSEISIEPKARHVYTELNKEYIVSISGNCDAIESYHLTQELRNKIIKIIQWGEIGLNFINFSDCENLIEIASPTPKSFENITDFSGVFGNCISLTTLPQDLFDNCPNVESFRGTFDGCINLTGDPIPLWDKYDNVMSAGCYYNCTNLNNYNDIIIYWREYPA